MSDPLDPSQTPSSLNTSSSPVRRLSKVPAMIIMGVFVVVVGVLGYSISQRGKVDVVAEGQVEEAEYSSSISEANEIIKDYEQAYTPLKNESPKPEKVKPVVAQAEPINEVAPIPRGARQTASPIKPVDHEANVAALERIAAIKTAKEKALFKALSSTSSVGVSTSLYKDDTKKKTADPRSELSQITGIPQRDRAAEMQQIREAVARSGSGNNGAQDAGMQRIEKLLLAIASNTSNNNQSTSSQSTSRPSTSSQSTSSQSTSRPSTSSQSTTIPLNVIPTVNRPNSVNQNANWQSNNRPNPVNQNANWQNNNRPSSTGSDFDAQQRYITELMAKAPQGTFLQEAKRDYGYSNEWQREQLTDTDLRVGTVIPAIMINGINSELAGTVIAQVSQNIWDTTHGRHILIPQGTRVIGNYTGDVQHGQSRVAVAWNRLQFPNGKTLSISTMGGADQAGYTGFSDLVNKHYTKTFGGATLLSIISGLASSAASDDDVSSQSTEETLSDSIAEKYAEVGTQMIEQSLKIKPTVIIRPGYRFTIIVNKDFVLDAYEG